MIGVVLPTENSQLFRGNFPSIQLWHLAPRTPDDRGCWKQSSMVTQGFCYSEQALSCHLIKLKKAASSFPRHPSSLPSTRIGGRNPVLITACEEWAKNMLPNISQAQESRDLPGGRMGRGLLTVCSEGRLWLMGCPAGSSPHSPHALLSHQFPCESESRSVVSDSLWPHGLYSPWNSPGQNTGVGSLSLLQGIFLTQESNQGLLHCRRILYKLNYQGSPPFPWSCSSAEIQGGLHRRIGVWVERSEPNGQKDPILTMSPLPAFLHWKRPWCWERLKAKGEVGGREWMIRWHHWFNGHESE